MDEPHLLWSAGVLFVVGADVLWTAYRRLRSLGGVRWHTTGGQAALFLSLTLVPVTAALPHVWWRVDTWSWLVPASAEAEHAATNAARAHLQPLDLPGTQEHLWVPAEQAGPIQEVVDMLQASTAPGEPIFTYPAIPGFYYLADRPNATRFNHLVPGMAAPADQEDMVRQLATVRYVVWDDGGAHYWVQPGDNAPVTEYIRTHFRVERFIGPWAVLSRDAAGPALTYFVPGSG
jgi:hypothetical protein